MKVAVVGSGPAGLACAKGLIARGIAVEVLDTGEELDPERKRIVEALRQRPFAEWDAGLVARIKDNPTFNGGGIPRRRWFGSDFVFANERDRSALTIEGTPFTPTYAKGGFSTVWGASILPVAERDIEGWPIRRSALEPYYRKLLSEMPLSAERSALDQELPLYTDVFDALPLPTQCADLLKRLRSRATDLERIGLRFGRSRLAVRNKSDGALQGCCSCGLCLYGCVPDAIYSTVPDIERLHAAGALHYCGGRAVESVRESAHRVEVTWRHNDGTAGSASYEAVFLALGALNTSRLLIRSLTLFDRTAVLLDSQKFILPLLAAKPSPSAIVERKPILPGLFLDLLDPTIDPHWIHGQIYPVSQPVVSSLGVDFNKPRQLRLRLLAPLLQRLMIAWISMHSDHSGFLEVRVDPRDLRTHVRAVHRRNTQRHIRAVARRYFHAGLMVRTLALLPGIQIGAPGAGNHIGGSFPMREAPRDAMETDLWGRPVGCRRIFAVDASILPSIPSTTIAFTIMANACRIGTEAPLDALS